MDCDADDGSDEYLDRLEAELAAAEAVEAEAAASEASSTAAFRLSEAKQAAWLEQRRARQAWAKQLDQVGDVTIDQSKIIARFLAEHFSFTASSD
eukprot:12791410-Heterocapsa_arctica.AAC.1